MWAFSASACSMQGPSTAKEWKQICAPTHPTVAQPRKGRWHPISRVGRENAKQCSSKATPCSSLRDLANCGELRKASVYDVLEFKPHLKGS